MSEKPFRRARRWQRLAIPLLALIFVLAAGQLGTAVASSNTFYLRAAGVPHGILSEVPPSGETLPNFDPGRDDEPGLLVKKGGSSGETDPRKFQQWTAAVGPLDLDGAVTFSFWSAMRNFATNKRGSVKASLLDCDLAGEDCVRVDSARRSRNPWSDDPGWVLRTINFEGVEHSIAADRSLGVKIIVTDKSKGDMWFAYDTAAFPSALTVEAASAPPSTTTTTTTTPPNPTTTTTAPPPAATTTTTPPNPTTTTTAPPPAATTTTTPPNPTTTTISPLPAATTTTIPPPSVATTTSKIAAATTVPYSSTEPPATDPAPLEEPSGEQEVALAARSPSDDGDHGGALSGALLDGLEVAIPPSIASSLLSPLLLLESTVGAFTATGRDLTMPALLLVVGVLWTEGRRRRRPGPILDEAIAEIQQ